MGHAGQSTVTSWSKVAAAAKAFFRIVGPTALALLLCNMDRICMSVAILPMAKEFGWPAGVQVITHHTRHMFQKHKIKTNKVKDSEHQ